jgi:hypothetical protein
MIICTPDEDVIIENVAPLQVGPDEPFVVVTVSLTPDEAQVLVDTLPSNNSTARAARDPLSRAVLEAIKNSGVLDA